MKRFKLSKLANSLPLPKFSLYLKGIILSEFSITHVAYEPDAQTKIGITKNLVRISVGLEYNDDIKYIGENIGTYDA